MGKVVSQEDLVTLRAQWKADRRRMVFTNGVFDILHRGHVEYLSKAKALGDVLVVGLNTDASVQRLKGPTRPVVGQEDRAVVMAALAAVDYVCLFDEDTPLRLITAIVPDVLVKGADWSIDKVVGREVVEGAGGRVQTIDFVPDRSTTSLIDRIRSSGR